MAQEMECDVLPCRGVPSVLNPIVMLALCYGSSWLESSWTVENGRQIPPHPETLGCLLLVLHQEQCIVCD